MSPTAIPGLGHARELQSVKLKPRIKGHKHEITANIRSLTPRLILHCWPSRPRVTSRERPNESVTVCYAWKVFNMLVSCVGVFLF